MDRLNIILGAGGFVGSYLQGYFRNTSKDPFKALYKTTFDICDVNSYHQLMVDKQLFIFDTINANNLNKAEIERVNIQGHKNFIDWLNRNNIYYHYIYFSTLSTLRISEHLSNDYILSKFTAENYVRENCENHTIIRLSFLFGKGENKNRLLSRIISNLQAGQDIFVDDVYLNLTPIEELGILLENNEFVKYKEINFIDGVAYRLQELVSIIIDKMRPTKSKINFTDKKIDLAFNQNFFKDGHTFKVREALTQMIEGV